MATRTRDDDSTKEKRGASSLGKISPKSSKIDSPDPKVRTPTSSDKHVPNYLKPTLSSGLEASKQQGKKPVDAAAASSHKPALNRRRSFDSKPQSPTQRSRASLKPTLRSSSFSGKTDKNSMMRGNKEGAARSVGTTVKKQQRSAGETSTMKKEESPPSTKIFDDAIEIEIKGCDVREHANVEEDEEIVQIGDRTEAVEIVKDDDQIVINEETVSSQEDTEENATNEENINDISNDETGADNVRANAGDKDLKGEEASLSGESAKNDDTAIPSEDKETKVKEVVVVTQPKSETINTAAKYQGKRESAISNDVIEETASKLREQRKNKVKALAGAFETVISLQETKY